MEVPLTLTRISSKGQVVIPGSLRKKLHINSGEYFAVGRVKNMIVLKSVSGGMTAADIKTLEKLNEAWQDLESGRFKKGTLDELMKELS
ncbi:MAG: AbrB/MazE/SpoVT family DNA-binding domain-containing protein [Candidatus Micrarchaeota archaeon]